jgi:hypothetical protein
MQKRDEAHPCRMGLCRRGPLEMALAGDTKYGSSIFEYYY